MSALEVLVVVSRPFLWVLVFFFVGFVVFLNFVGGAGYVKLLVRLILLLVAGQMLEIGYGGI